MWPFTKRADLPRETRAAFPSVTAEHLAGRRAGVLSDGAVPLSATVAESHKLGVEHLRCWTRIPTRTP